MTGRKPKPTDLHVVNGTVNVTRHANRVDEPHPTGRPVKPQIVKGRAAKIWDEYLEIGFWLTSAESHLFGMWCCLAAKLEKDIKNGDFVASLIARYDAMGSSLGFDPASRARLNITSSDRKKETPAQKYFSANNG